MIHNGCPMHDTQITRHDFNPLPTANNTSTTVTQFSSTFYDDIVFVTSSRNTCNYSNVLCQKTLVDQDLEF